MNMMTKEQKAEFDLLYDMFKELKKTVEFYETGVLDSETGTQADADIKKGYEDKLAIIADRLKKLWREISENI